MKVKKIFTLVLACCFIFNINFVNAVNNESKYEKILYQSKEITDSNVILDRMEKGITDDKDFKATCNLSTDSFIDSDGKEYSLKVKSVKSTSQKIKEIALNEEDTSIALNEEDTSSEYVANILATVALTSTSTSTSTDETSTYDTEGHNAKLYIRVSYTSDTIDSYTLLKVTTMSGKLERLDNSILLKNLEIIQNILGTEYSSPSSSGEIGASDYSATSSKDNPYSNSWYNSTNLSKNYWTIGDSSVSMYQGIVRGYFARGGSSWSADVTWER